MDKLKQLVSSRKFWAALAGLVMIVIKAYQPNFPVTDEQLVGIVGVLVAYILGVAVEDAGHARGSQ